MKFIKTDCGYVNAAHIKLIYVTDIGERKPEYTLRLDGENKAYYFTETFKTKEKAEEYLDELIEELEEQ